MSSAGVLRRDDCRPEWRQRTGAGLASKRTRHIAGQSDQGRLKCWMLATVTGPRTEMEGPLLSRGKMRAGPEQV